MALATQCPHCHTAFRVAHDQLKLRAGLVRCGACKQVFNGIEHLLPPYAGEAPPAASPVHRPAAPATRETIDNRHLAQSEASAAHDVEPSDAASADMSPRQDEPDADHADVDPLQRMTLMDFTLLARRSADDDEATEDNRAAETPPSDQDPDAPDRLAQAIDALQHRPVGRNADEFDDGIGADVHDEEPSFVRQGRRRQRVGRAMRILMAAGSVALFLGLLAQGIHTFGNQVAAWLPQAKPLLARACSLLDCRIGLPAQIEMVSLESSELQALTPDKNTFALTVLLRNRGAVAQTWPNIELTLNDAAEKPLVRRVLLPRDYLASAQETDKGLAARSEQTIKVFFELSQLKASGFRVYLFYP